MKPTDNSLNNPAITSNKIGGVRTRSSPRKLLDTTLEIIPESQDIEIISSSDTKDGELDFSLLENVQSIIISSP